MVKTGNELALALQELAGGEERSGFLTTGFHRYGQAISMPFRVIRSKNEGPVVWIQGAVHGAEKTGTAAIVRLAQTLRPDSISGTLVLIPVVNVLAFESGKRANHIDALPMDLNRHFPGQIDGSFTERIAARLWEVVHNSVNYLIDIHTASGYRVCPLHVLYRDVANEASKRAREMCFWALTSAVWSSNEPVLDRSLMHVATENGIPSIVLEAGPGEDVSLEHMEQLVRALTNILSGLGVLPGTPELLDKYMILKGWANVMANRGGLCLPLVQPGDVVEEGQPIAHVVSLLGDVLETTHSPFGPAFVRSLVRPFMPIASGERVVAVLKVTGEVEPSTLGLRRFYEVCSVPFEKGRRGREMEGRAARQLDV